MHTPTVLLVEDNADDADLVRRVLARGRVPAQVHVATDGVEALELLLSGGTPEGPPVPDLVLLDLKMPRLDGFAVLRRLRAEGRRLPLVVFTSSDEARDVRACFELGASSYVRKPVDYHDYAAAVLKIMDYWLNLNEPVARRGSRPRAPSPLAPAAAATVSLVETPPSD